MSADSYNLKIEKEVDSLITQLTLEILQKRPHSAEINKFILNFLLEVQKNRIKDSPSKINDSQNKLEPFLEKV